MNVDLQETLKLQRVVLCTLWFRHYMQLPVSRPGRFIPQAIFL